MSVTLAVEIESSSPLRGRVRQPYGQLCAFGGWTALAVLVGEATEQVPEVVESPRAEP